MQAYEIELKKYLAVEQAVTAIPPTHFIGPLWIDTIALKANLIAEAAAWKAQFAKNLHKRGKDSLQVRKTNV